MKFKIGDKVKVIFSGEDGKIVERSSTSFPPYVVQFKDGTRGHCTEDQMKLIKKDNDWNEESI